MGGRRRLEGAVQAHSATMDLHAISALKKDPVINKKC